MEWNNFSLKLHQHNGKPFIIASDLFEIIFPYSKQKYARWVKMNITDQPQELPVKGVDFISFEDAKLKADVRNKRGPRRQEYLISLTFALQLCYQAKTLPSKAVKDFLYTLTEK